MKKNKVIFGIPNKCGIFCSLIFSISSFSLSSENSLEYCRRPHWVLGTNKMTSEKKDRKRVALVTGANRGLGFETCRQLAQLGYIVILSARDFTKGGISAKQLIEEVWT